MKALSFGEILWDLYPEKKYIGGATLNFAAHLARHGEQSYIFSAVGDDELGYDAVSCLKKTGCSAKYVSVLKNKPTGRCIVSLNENSVPSYDLLQDVAYDYIPFRSVSEGFDLLYFGTLALRGGGNFAVLKRLIRENDFPDIFVDVNIRKPFCSKASVQFAAETATVLKISAEELPTVGELLDIPNVNDYKYFSQALAKSNALLKCIIITCGADGAYAYNCSTGTEYSCPAVKSNVRSTVGAGDSFSAAFMYWYLRQKDIQYCLDYAAQVAGYVVSEYDAVPEYKIDRFGV